MKPNNTFEEILNTLKKSQNILLASHTGADLDSIGSNIALKLILKNLGINADFYSVDNLPVGLTDLVDCQHVNAPVDIATIDLSKYDTFLGLDVDTTDRVTKTDGFKLPENIKTKVYIDHHQTSLGMGDLNYVDKNASSATLLIFRMSKELNIPLNKQIGEYILLGILGDTGTFQFSNTHPEDLKAVTELIEKYDVNMFNMIYNMTFNEPIELFKMKRIIYNNLKVDFENRFAYTTYTQKEKADAGIDPNIGLPAVSDTIKRLKGVDFVFVISETKDKVNEYHLGMRSHEKNFDVSKIAIKLGGGGHKPAAAAKLTNQKSIDEAIQTVISTIAEM
ncbi:MAG: hypothetical protein ACD_22C00173G0009, partial [uncultured bacterium]